MGSIALRQASLKTTRSSRGRAQHAPDPSSESPLRAPGLNREDDGVATGHMAGKAMVAQIDAGLAPGPREVKRGRPRLEDAARTLTAKKPWQALGMSRATWYKRQAEKAAVDAG